MRFAERGQLWKKGLQREDCTSFAKTTYFAKAQGLGYVPSWREKLELPVTALVL